MSQSWKRRHPDWQYILWTDRMNRDFIVEHFPDFLPTYDGYARPIQRVDAVRYHILYKYGGFFIDLDFECLASIEPIIGDASCLFGKEPVEHCTIHKRKMIISNAFMGAAPGASFFRLLCQELERDPAFTGDANDRILETTGPFMLSRLYAGYGRKEEITVLEDDLLYPVTKDEIEEVGRGVVSKKVSEKLRSAYGIHHYAGTWWKNNNL